MTEAVESAVLSPAGVRLAVCQSGPADGRAVVLLHGITMTRDYVLMGSTELEQNGYRVIAYDARGHGRSTAPADPAAYGYDELLADLLAVLDTFDVDRAVLVGSSMGCHTAIRLALDHPERVAAITAITPAYDPVAHPNEDDVRDADRLAEAMRREGADGYIEGLKEMGDPAVAMTFLSLTRRRLAQHRDLGAVADALQANLRARPFNAFGELAAIGVPALVVASRDELDPRHPYDLARAYAAALPESDLVSEPEGRAPLAWNGRKLARRVLDLASRAHYLTNRDRLSTLPSPGS
ncbi:MAG TPA: alpha/beta hydrolase [Thermoleophilaceae bacterium]|nr:alpha/beta hydrolase [Thermoleophilaceae bacterium]